MSIVRLSEVAEKRSIRLLSLFVVPGSSFGDSVESLIRRSEGFVDVRRYAAYLLGRRHGLVSRRRLGGMG